MKVQVMIKNGTEFDFIFISYDEECAEEHWHELLKTVPYAKRVHGVQGEADAWKEAARRAETTHFFTMDADQRLRPDFSFRIFNWQESDQRLHVWRSKNPVNGLVYGHGSIHLFHKDCVLENDNTDVLDFTLASAHKGFVIQEEQASETHFNFHPYQTWRSAFKECAKLASKTSYYPGTNQEPGITDARIWAWCSLGADAENGYWSILGARMGTLYGLQRQDDKEQLMEQKDYDFFNQYWKDKNINVYNLNTHLFETEVELKSDWQVYCWTLLPDQSETLKMFLYNFNRDVINRFCVRSDVPKDWLNY